MDFDMIDEDNIAESKIEPIKIDDITLSDGQKIKIKKVEKDYIDFRRANGYTGDCRLYLAVSDKEEAANETAAELEKYISKKK